MSDKPKHMFSETAFITECPECNIRFDAQWKQKDAAYKAALKIAAPQVPESASLGGLSVSGQKSPADAALGTTAAGPVHPFKDQPIASDKPQSETGKLTRCSVSFEHPPHDYCDGNPGAEFGKRTDKPQISPCPCCGYRAEIEQVPHEPETANSGGYYIECKRAGCGITTRLAFACKDDPLPGLIESWNRRYMPSATATTWLPIESAPRDGTDILLVEMQADGLGEIDLGSWGFIEKSDWDGGDVYGWLSNYGRVNEPTHWIPRPIVAADSSKAT